MKNVLLLSVVLFYLNANAQTSRHALYVGGNVSGIDLDLSSSGIHGLDRRDFSKARTGFMLGYKYQLALSSRWTMGTGLSFNNFNYEFHRPFYNEPGDINPNLTSVSETMNFYRFSIPVQVSYNFIKAEKHSVYTSLGADLNLTNNVSRTADYKIPGPPTGFVDGQFKKNQSIKFNENSFGLSLVASIGSEIEIRNKTFLIELSYYNDISESRFQTLKNIEQDNYYFGRLKSVQVKIGYVF